MVNSLCSFWIVLYGSRNKLFLYSVSDLLTAINLAHALRCFRTNTRVKGKVGQTVEVLDHLCSVFAQDFISYVTREADLFAFAVLVHMGFYFVTSDDDVFGTEVADGIAGIVAGKFVPVVGELTENQRRIG